MRNNKIGQLKNGQTVYGIFKKTLEFDKGVYPIYVCSINPISEYVTFFSQELNKKTVCKFRDIERYIYFAESEAKEVYSDLCAFTNLDSGLIFYD